MTNTAIFDSRFAERLKQFDESLSDSSRRLLLFQYAKLYQDAYWFDQLESAFAILELTDLKPSLLPNELPNVMQDIDYAIGEYFESLNYAATAVKRIFDERPICRDNLIETIGLIWDAHACNEKPDAFTDREDAVLCELLESALTRNGG